MNFRDGSLLVCFLLSFGANSLARASTETSTQVVTAAAPESAKKWVFVGEMEASSTLHQLDDPDRQTGLEWSFTSIFKAAENIEFRGAVTLEKDLRNEQQWNAGNLSLLGRRTFPLGSKWKVAAGLTTVLPVSSQSRRRESLIASTQPNFRILWSNRTTLMARYQIGLTRRVHQYETATDGKSNAPWAVPQSLLVTLTLGGWEVASEFTYTLNQSYEGNRSGSFTWNQSLSYAVSEKVSVGLGFSNSGNALGANGRDLNVALMDRQQSRVSGSISITL